MDTDSFLWGLDNALGGGFTLEIVAYLILVLALLFFSGLISASEVAFFSLPAKDLTEIKLAKNADDAIVKELLVRSESLLASILLLNNIVNIALLLIVLYICDCWFGLFDWPVLDIVLLMVGMAVAMLLFCETLPKVLVQGKQLGFVRWCATFMRVMERLLRPVTRLLLSSSSLMSRWVAKKRESLSMDGLSKALEMETSGISEEKEMLVEIMKFHDKTAAEIMTSRLDLSDIEIQTPFRKVISFVVSCGYSRIPVFSGTVDNIKGVLYIKDLLPYIDKPDTFHWQSLIRPAYFVPETKKIDDLLEEFRMNKIHLAVVVDEFGGTCGIVTMEDILEEIVGEISDEYDEDERQYLRLSDGNFIFEAKILLTDFFRVTDVDPADFGELTEEVETLAGLLLEIKGDFPRRHEVIEYGKYRFQMLEVDNRRIQKVKFYSCLGDTAVDDKRLGEHEDA